MCLTNTLNDSLARRFFRITIKLSSQNKRMIFTNFFVNCECIKIYTIINKIIVFEVCKQLQIELCFFSKLKSLRDYNEQLIKKFIIYHLLFILNVHNHKKDLYFIFIAKIKQHNFIFGKL